MRFATPSSHSLPFAASRLAGDGEAPFIRQRATLAATVEQVHEVKQLCPACFGKGKTKTLEGAMVTCMGCSGLGSIDDGRSRQVGPLDPEWGISLLCGAIAAFAANRDGSIGMGGAWSVAAVVALLVKLTIARVLVHVMRMFLQVALVLGLLALVGYCAQTFG